MKARTANTIRKATIVIIASSVVLWIAWDIVVSALGFNRATESQILLVAGFCHFSGPVALGFVLGHITWPAPKVDYKGWRLVSSMVYFAALFGANFWQLIPAVIPVVPLVLHIPLGRLGWPQSVRLLPGGRT